MKQIPKPMIIIPTEVADNIFNIILNDNFILNDNKQNNTELNKYINNIKQYASKNHFIDIIKQLKLKIFKHLTDINDNDLNNDNCKLMKQNQIKYFIDIIKKIDNSQKKIYKLEFNDKSDFVIDFLIDYNYRNRIKNFKLLDINTKNYIINDIIKQNNLFFFNKSHFDKINSYIKDIYKNCF